MNKEVLVLGVAIVAMFGFAFVTKDKTQEVVVRTVDGDKVQLSASAGPEHYVRQFFNEGSTEGGRLATTSTASTYTLTAKDLNGTPTYIDWLPNINTTVSLSGTSTHAYVPNVGDVATVYLRNASSTAGATITLASVDAGLDLQDNEDSADLAINGLDYAKLTLIRESANLVSVLFQEFTEAD